MAFNILSGVILWLKKVFCIRPKTRYEKKETRVEVLPEKIAIEITQPPEEKSVKVTSTEGKPGEVSSEEEKLVEVSLSGKKTEVIPEPEERPPEIPSEKEPIETKPPERKTPEVPPKKKTRKPYKKKAPTEERTKERKKLSEDDEKLSIPKRGKEIDLGAKRKKPKPTKQLQQAAELSIEKTEKEFGRKETLTRIESPFIEIDLDEAKVFIIIPMQQFKSSTASNIPQQLQYEMELNGGKHPIAVKASEDEHGIIKVEEEIIELENPLENFKVVFPDELQGEIKTYSYNHNNANLYAFVAIGNNQGKMYYIYDKDGNINPLPDTKLLLSRSLVL